MGISARGGPYISPYTDVLEIINKSEAMKYEINGVNSMTEVI